MVKKFEEFIVDSYQDFGVQDEMESWMLFEMSKVGEFKGKKYNFTIFVNTDDPGNTPHFHIIDSSSYRNKKSGPWEFHTCLEIRNPKYFHHKSIRKEDRITNEFAEKLIKFLSSDKKANFTYWQYILTLWNDNNSKQIVDEDNTPIPDYTKVNDD